MDGRNSQSYRSNHIKGVNEMIPDRMNYFVLWPAVFILSHFLYSQSPEGTPEKVYRYCYIIQSEDWYKNQEALWKGKISENPQDENAWNNYYFASRYAHMGMDEYERKKMLDLIVSEIRKAIPGSYLVPYVQYYNGDRKIEHLQKALQLKPDCADLYWEFVQYYELNGDQPQKKLYCEKLYASQIIISSLYDYNFNMLNSAEKNSILFTNGDNDNYPAWVLQEAKGVRRDVTVLNVHTVFVLRDYLKMKLDGRGLEIDITRLPEDDISVFMKELVYSIKKNYPDIPIHVAPTVYDEYKKELNNQLVLTGLDYTFSNEEFDPIARIRENLERNLRLDYLEYDWYNEHHITQTMMHRLNLNYIPSFMKLSKMYDSSGEIELAKYWKNKAISLAEKAGDNNLIKQLDEAYP
jgi:hypothetical protein